MTRPHLIARLIFAAMGVHLLMDFLSEISSAVVMTNQNCPPETFNAKIFIITAQLVITMSVSLILLFRPDGLIRIIAGPDAGQCEKIDDIWIITGFRMTACFCGFLIFFPRAERLLYYVTILKSSILSYMTLQGQSSLLSTKILTGIVTEITKWVVAIYLILGAPHYVRWQTKLALKSDGVKT